jgi:hypothetical protein
VRPAVHEAQDKVTKLLSLSPGYRKRFISIRPVQGTPYLKEQVVGYSHVRTNTDQRYEESPKRLMHREMQYSSRVGARAGSKLGEIEYIAKQSIH